MVAEDGHNQLPHLSPNPHSGANSEPGLPSSSAKQGVGMYRNTGVPNSNQLITMPNRLAK